MFSQANIKPDDEDTSTKSASKEKFIGLGEFTLYTSMQNSAPTSFGGIFRTKYTTNLFMMLVIVALVGMPLKYAQIMLGFYTRRSEVFLKYLSPIGYSVGYVMALVSVLKMSKTIVQVADTTLYMMSSFQLQEPWMNCAFSDPRYCWAGEPCPGECINTTRRASGYVYWKYEHASGSSSNPYPRKYFFGCLCWCVIVLILLKTRNIAGKTVSVLFICSIAILILLEVAIVIMKYGNRNNVLRFLLTIPKETLFNAKLWLDTVKTVARLETIGCAGNVLMGSRIKPTGSPGLYCVVGSLVQLTIIIIFNALYHFTAAIILEKANITTDKREYLCESVYEPIYLFVEPNGLGFLPVPQLWTILYLLSVTIVIITHGLMHLRLAELSIMDVHSCYEKYRKYMLFGFAISVTILAIPFTTGDQTRLHRIYGLKQGTVIIEAVNVAVVSIVICWIYGVRNLCDDIQFVLDYQPVLYWKVCLYMAPALTFASLVLILMQFEYQVWSVVLLAISLPLFIILTSIRIFKCIKSKGFLALFYRAEEWGPPEPADRIIRIYFNPRKETKATRKKIKCSHKCLVHCKTLNRLIKEESIFQAATDTNVRHRYIETDIRSPVSIESLYMD